MHSFVVQGATFLRAGMAHTITLCGVCPRAKHLDLKLNRLKDRPKDGFLPGYPPTHAPAHHYQDLPFDVDQIVNLASLISDEPVAPILEGSQVKIEESKAGIRSIAEGQ